MRKMCSKEERLKFCVKWRASGLTQKVFCNQQGITSKALGRWLRFEKKQQGIKFLPVTANQQSKEAKEVIEIFLPNNRYFKIAAEKRFLIGLMKELMR